MQQFTSGTFDVGYEAERVPLEATPDRPVYRHCRGAMATGCPYDAWRREQARPAKTGGKGGSSREEAL